MERSSTNLEIGRSVSPLRFSFNQLEETSIGMLEKLRPVDIDPFLNQFMVTTYPPTDYVRQITRQTFMLNLCQVFHEWHVIYDCALPHVSAIL